jgi:hypothetical protein
MWQKTTVAICTFSLWIINLNRLICAKLTFTSYLTSYQLTIAQTNKFSQQTISNQKILNTPRKVVHKPTPKVPFNNSHTSFNMSQQSHQNQHSHITQPKISQTNQTKSVKSNTTILVFNTKQKAKIKFR